MDTSTENLANPVNNFESVLNNIGRRFSKSNMTPINRDSVNFNTSKNADINNKENINNSNNKDVASERENKEGNFINNYVQISNFININANNFDGNSVPPKIEIEMKSDFNRDATAPSLLKKKRKIKNKI